MRARLAALVLLAAGAATASALPPPRAAVPLDGPVDVDELLRLARVRQALNSRTYLLYSFRQTSRIEDLAEDGSLKRRETKVYRVIPSREGTVRHLLESDGEPPSPREVRKQEARNEKLQARWEKLRAKQAKLRAKKVAEAEARSAEARAAREREAASSTGAGTDAGPPPGARTAPKGPGSPAAAPPAPSPARAAAASPPPGGSSPPVPTTPAEGAPRTASAPALTATVTEPAADGPPIPECDLSEPSSSLRPPPPGSVTSARLKPRIAAEEVRRARKTAGDYTLFELLSLTSYEYEGACRYDGRAVHVVSFAPADDFDAQNPVERVVTAMAGIIFIDAVDVQVMRTEGRTIAPIKWGAGLVALREARVLFEARKVNDEVWLPATDVFEFDARVLFDRDRQRVTQHYDDYSKLSVSSEEVFEGVVPDPLPEG